MKNKLPIDPSTLRPTYDAYPRLLGRTPSASASASPTSVSAAAKLMRGSFAVSDGGPAAHRQHTEPDQEGAGRHCATDHDRHADRVGGATLGGGDGPVELTTGGG